MKVNLVNYDDKYKEQLNNLLIELSKELFGEGTANLDEFVANHWVIYLALVDGEVVGFASFIYNTYYGLKQPTTGMTYLYVKPNYRNTKVSYLLSIQAGNLSITSNLPLENYYASEASSKIGRKMKGTLMYTAYHYPVEEVNKLYGHLINKVRIEQ